MASKSTAATGLVISYLWLRRAVGVIGTSLPFVLVFGTWLLGGRGIEPSISAYYYTSMRDAFVGSLCAIGVFLLSYRGYDRVDNVTGNLACIFAVGIALFPTSPAIGATAAMTLVGHIHLVFASAYFLTLAFFSLVLFRKTNPDGRMTERKKQRNIIYAVCGYAILVCIGLVVVDMVFFKHTALQTIDPVFWLESGAVLAFGISWLTKGETILADVGCMSADRDETPAPSGSDDPEGV
jgi:hypothetical protein